MFNCRKPLYFKGFRRVKFQTALGIPNQSGSRVYIAAPRRAKLFFENKKVLSRSRERTSKRKNAKFQAKAMRNYAKLCEMKRNLFRIFRLSASANRLQEERVKKSAVIQRKSSWKSVNNILISPWICAMIIPSRVMGG